MAYLAWCIVASGSQQQQRQLYRFKRQVECAFAFVGFFLSRQSTAFLPVQFALFAFETQFGFLLTMDNAPVASSSSAAKRSSSIGPKIFARFR